jgi:pimeloyl-ACP methyl ester carboxylesterase
MQEISHSCGYAATDPALWVDHLTPDQGTTKPPLVLMHGGGHTGTCYLKKPDGGEGWAEHFAKLGYLVHVLDWPGMGRSGRVEYPDLTGDFVCKTIGAFIETLPEPCVLLTHSMSGAYGWRLVQNFGRRIKAVVGVAPSPPGNIQDEPEILEQTDSYVVVQRGAFQRRVDLDQPTPFNQDLVENKLIGGGDKFPRDCIGAYAASLTGTPPRLAYERGNIAGSQLKVTNTAPFTNKPILVVTADHDRDHTRDIDGAVADWLREIGAAAEFCYLPDRGIAGNGHMMMLEQNSGEIADLIAGWIDSTIAN